ncbi:MAG TPA: hypothetical protein VJM11_09445 [Nevskiaceae bacterium]|nr:hypothetical protein [Nevskiaceae bacterium]
MTDRPVSDQDRRRKRAMIVFQLLIYSWILVTFLIQLYLYSKSDW